MNFSTLLVSSDVVFLGIMVLALGGLMVFTSIRRRKYGAQLQDIRNNIKKGDKVMSETGIVGEVVDIETDDQVKYFTIKTGSDKNFGYIKLHSNAIYYVFDKNASKAQAKVEQVKTTETEKVVDDKADADNNIATQDVKTEEVDK